MKKYKWNKEKFKENMQPFIGLAAIVGLGIVWI